MANLAEGTVVTGTVKNLTDYGAFIDLGGVDGLLHVSDMSFGRVRHPSEIVQVGQTITAKVLKFDPSKERISLGMKQAMEDPWESAMTRYVPGARAIGRVVSITDYGAFVELEDGIEGLIHVSEMSWTKKNVHPGKILSTSEAVEVQVLDIDSAKRRISLGLKQTQKNPWEAFADKYPPGAEVEGEVKNITEFGLFIGLDGDVDGMVHLSDIDWKRSGEEAIKDFKKGDRVHAKVLDVDREKERISLGIKQLGSDPIASVAGLKKGETVTCEVVKVEDNGLEVKVAGTDMTAYVKRADLARDRAEQRPERFAVGEKFDAKITVLDTKARKMNVSIKALEIAEEKEAVAQYGSSDSGASLGDILGAALKRKDDDSAE
jgi:small subunit ribosomal protein S1